MPFFMLPFYNTLNELYNFTVQFMPDFFKQNSELTAYILGYSGSVSLTKTAQKVFKKLPESLDSLIADFEVAALTMLPFTVVVLASDNEIYPLLQEHTTYTMGVLGVILGAYFPTLKRVYEKYQLYKESQKE